MSFLVVGLTHRETPIDVLERAAVARADLAAGVERILDNEDIGEAMILSTCNRVEVYADVTRFHGGLSALVSWISERIGSEPADLVPYLQVRYGDEAVEHALKVASGLDSLVVGEPQVLGQFRGAYLDSIEAGSVGRELHQLSQHALRVGKRVHSELGLSELGRNIASVAVELATEDIDQPAARCAIVFGAGSMASLAAHSLTRRGIGDVAILNRSPERAERLAAAAGGRAAVVDALDSELVTADILVTAVSSTAPVITAERITAARGARPLIIVDLALPKNVDNATITLPGITYIGLNEIKLRAAELAVDVDAEAAATLIQQEVAAFGSHQRSAAVVPTVTALRAKAAAVVDLELTRLRRRTPDLDPVSMGEVEYAITRIVDKLLHTPSVRVRELAGTPSGAAYAEALQLLFDLPGGSDRDLSAAVDPGIQDAASALERAVAAYGGPR